MSANPYSYSTNAPTNTTLDGVSIATGMYVGNVDDALRQLTASVATILGDLGGSLAAGGTANAITLTANSTFSTYADPRIVSFKASADNTAATTLNVNAVGAKSVRKMTQNGDVALAGGEIQEDGIYTVQYSEDANSAAGGWILVNPTRAIDITDWAPYTPTFTGFGTAASVTFFWRRVNDTLEIRGRFTVGTPTATEARISLPSGFSTTSDNGGIHVVGMYTSSLAAAGSGYVLGANALSYVTFGFQNASLGGTSNRDGNAIVSTSSIMTLSASLRIDGW